MDDDVATDYDVLHNAYKSCKRDLKKADYMARKLPKTLLCHNMAIKLRIKWPEYFNRAARFRDSKHVGFADGLRVNEDY